MKYQISQPISGLDSEQPLIKLLLLLLAGTLNSTIYVYNDNELFKNLTLHFFQGTADILNHSYDYLNI